MRLTTEEIQTSVTTCVAAMPTLVSIAKAALKWRDAQLAWAEAKCELHTAKNDREYRAACDRIVPISAARDEAYSALLLELNAVAQ